MFPEAGQSIQLCSYLFLLIRVIELRNARESDRHLIAAQPDRCKEKYRGHCEPGPQTWRAKKMLGNECRHEILRGTVRRHGISWPHQALQQQREEMRGVECNLLHHADHERRQRSPYKWSARCPC